MKRTSSLLLALLCCLSLAACSTQQSQTPPPAKLVLIGAADADTGNTPMDEMESAAILSLLERQEWTDGLTDCAADVVLTLPDGSVMRYHSGCGTFIDYEGQRSLSISDDEQFSVNTIFSRYVVLEATGEDGTGWGITLTVKDVTPTGLTLVCTQSGGNPTGELTTGSYFVVERWSESGWEAVDMVPMDGELAWTSEAWIVPMNGTAEWEVNWTWLYGTLPTGHYRIGKEFMDFRATGDYDTAMIYAEFSFGEMLID